MGWPWPRWEEARMTRVRTTWVTSIKSRQLPIIQWTHFTKSLRSKVLKNSSSLSWGRFIMTLWVSKLKPISTLSWSRICNQKSSPWNSKSVISKLNLRLIKLKKLKLLNNTLILRKNRRLGFASWINSWISQLFLTKIRVNILGLIQREPLRDLSPLWILKKKFRLRI